jgi:hypothetical protein
VEAGWGEDDERSFPVGVMSSSVWSCGVRFELRNEMTDFVRSILSGRFGRCFRCAGEWELALTLRSKDGQWVVNTEAVSTVVSFLGGARLTWWKGGMARSGI